MSHFAFISTYQSWPVISFSQNKRMFQNKAWLPTPELANGLGERTFCCGNVLTSGRIMCCCPRKVDWTPNIGGWVLPGPTIGCCLAIPLTGEVGGKLATSGDRRLVDGTVVPVTGFKWKFAPPVFTLGLDTVHWWPVPVQFTVVVCGKSSRLSKDRKNYSYYTLHATTTPTTQQDCRLFTFHPSRWK